MSSLVYIMFLICASGVVVAIVGMLVGKVLPDIKDYKLQKERIKADALIKAEEVRAKNQLEIEKLYASGHERPAVNRFGYDDELSKTRRSKERL